MANAIVKMYATTASKLSQLQVLDGQLIFVRDVRKIYLDMNGTRLEYSIIQVLASEEDRSNLLAPVEGFYFVESTHVMWRYKDKWTQISPSNLNPIFFGGTSDEFPPVGNSTTLYVTDDATYKWDTLLQKYVVVSNKTEWKTLEGE